MTLVSKVVSGWVLGGAACECMPALFTGTSVRPCSLSTGWMAAATDDALVRSGWVLDVVPLMLDPETAELAALPFSMERLAFMMGWFAEAGVMTLDAA